MILRKALLLGLGCVFILPSVTGSQTVIRVENVRFEQRERRVYIFYDLSGPAENYKVTLKLSSDGGERFDITPRAVSGDVGDNVSPGRGKQIIWDAFEDVRRLSGDNFVFAITAELAPAGPFYERWWFWALVGGAAGGAAAVTVREGEPSTGTIVINVPWPE